MDAAARRRSRDVLVFGGGVIPEADVRALEAAGVSRLFTPGASLQGIAAWLETTLDERTATDEEPVAIGPPNTRTP